MSFVPGFEHDVFISYAAADNTDDEGWVTSFHASLSLRLRGLVCGSLALFRDPKPAGQDAPARLTEAGGAAVLVAVVSGRYLPVQSCMAELRAAAEANDERRVLPVWIDDVDRDLLPSPVSRARGCSFFTKKTSRELPRRLRQSADSTARPYW